MANGAINFNLDQQDDVVLPDGVPAFDGGQFSNLRANLLQPNQSSVLGNADIDKLGKIRTRRGTFQLGPRATAGESPYAPPSGTLGTIIQGLTSYQTPDHNYVVAANDSKIWRFDDPNWSQIALGGIADQAEMLIYREGKINHLVVGPPAEDGYPAGTTVLTVKEVGYVGVTAPPSAQGGIVGVGEKLYFTNNLRSDWYEYTIAAVSGGPPVTQITLEEPGLVFAVKDGWKFVVARPAKNVGAHLSPTGTPYNGTLTITGYTGVVNHGEKFVIKSENKRYTVDTFAPATPASTTSLTGSWGSLATDFVADNDDVPVMFAQGNDKLYFTDGTGPIYAWDGSTLMNISQASILDYLTGSGYHEARTKPPQDVTILVWFQNRLIASGIAAEPDAIYFSDYFDGTSWDRDYQKVRIGGGESDPITGLLAWTDYNLIVFKKNSIYAINLDPSQNTDPNDSTLLVASFSVKQLHKRIGCPAPNSAVQVGGGSTTPGSDIFFVDGDKKVHSVRRVMAAETQQEVGQAVSLPIQDVLDTMNRDQIQKCAAIYHNEHYILAFPSTRGTGGGTWPNAVVAYNLLTQSWCGVWGWAPTCFAMRTDLGAYSKMIFGRTAFDDDGTVLGGDVVQWLDDIQLDEEVASSYEDYARPDGSGGVPITTTIATRAFTFQDFYSFKTGLSVEFEFDESTAEAVSVIVVLDKIPKSELIAYSRTNSNGTFTSASDPPLRLPFRLGDPLAIPPIPDVRVPANPGLLRKAFDLQRYGTWRELQFRIATNTDPLKGPVGGKLAVRSIRLTGFMDTLRLQTIPSEGVFLSEGDILVPPTEGP